MSTSTSPEPINPESTQSSMTGSPEPPRSHEDGRTSKDDADSSNALNGSASDNSEAILSGSDDVKAKDFISASHTVDEKETEKGDVLAEEVDEEDGSGDDADSDGEDEEEEEDSEEDESDGEEDEPALKYERIGGFFTDLFKKESASAMAISKGLVVM
jgi:vacuolar protein sorting-associated protein 41